MEDGNGGSGGGGGGGEVSPSVVSKVRVVRCPKCGKLLPELTGFKVYRCGGCNATLQAKKQISAKSGKSTSNVNVSEDNGSDSSLKAATTGSPASQTDSNDYKLQVSKEEEEETQIGRYRRPSKAPAALNSTSNFVRMYPSKSQGKAEIDDEDGARGGISGTLQQDARFDTANNGRRRQQKQHRSLGVSDPALFVKTLDVIRDQFSRPYDGPPANDKGRPRVKISAPSLNLNDHHSRRRRHRSDQMHNYSPLPLNQTQPQPHPPGHHYQNPSCRRRHQQQQSSMNHEFYHHHHHHHRPSCLCQHCGGGRSHWQIMPSSYVDDSYSSPWSGGSNLAQYPSYPNQNQHMVVSRNLRRRNECRPVAGGAPFVMCHTCFGILYVPRDLLSMGTGRKKMECGSCSQVIKFEVARNRLLISAPAKKTDTSSDLTSDDVHRNDGIFIQASPSNPMRSPVDGRVKEDHRSDSSDGLEDKIHASSSGMSKEEDDLKQNPVKNIPVVLPFSGMKLTEEEDSSKNFDREEHQEKFIRRSKDGNDDDLITATTTNGGRRIVNKKLAQSNQTSEKGDTRFCINGHLVPDHQVKNAEKLAGPVQPGNYWYDYHAGFWGVIGQPCLGMIMPHIEEFNYPMARKCGAGNTDVLVNGRELHHRDLKLLVDRGLPTSRGRSYMIEISGRVINAVSGKELNGLGKLAPTIENLKHGLGMVQPSVPTA